MITMSSRKAISSRLPIRGWNDSRQRFRCHPLIELSLITALVICAVFAPNASALRRADPWRWVVIERAVFASNGPGPLRMRLVTGPVLDRPAVAASVPGSVDAEAFFRLRVVGPPVSIGNAIGVGGGLACSRGVTDASRSFFWMVRPGQLLVLPGSPLPELSQGSKAGPHVAPLAATCVWSFVITSPTAGAGTHRATVEVSVISPFAGLVVGGGGQRYALQQCRVTVHAGGQDRSCRPLPQS